MPPELSPDPDETGVIAADGRYISTIWHATWNGGSLLACLFRASKPDRWVLRYRFKYDNGTRSGWRAEFPETMAEQQAIFLCRDALAGGLHAHKGVSVATIPVRDWRPDVIRRHLRAAGVKV